MSAVCYLKIVILHSEIQLDAFQNVWVDVVWLQTYATGVNLLEEGALALGNVLCRRGGHEDVVGLSGPVELDRFTGPVASEY